MQTYVLDFSQFGVFGLSVLETDLFWGITKCEWPIANDKCLIKCSFEKC